MNKYYQRVLTHRINNSYINTNTAVSYARSLGTLFKLLDTELSDFLDLVIV
jgi:hypothetical protein